MAALCFGLLLLAGPVEEALEAWRAGDAKELADLAASPRLDPWMVGDALLRRGEAAAAEAFARARRHADTERLPEYLSWRKEHPHDPGAQRALDAARAALEAGDAERALEALGAASTEGDDFATARRLYLETAIEERRGRPDRSWRAGVAAASAAERIGWLRLASYCLLDASARAQRDAAYGPLLEIAERALALETRRGDAEGEAHATEAAATALRGLGRPAESRERFEEALRRFEALGHRSGVAGSLGNLGLLEQETGSLDRALELQERALALKREIGAPGPIAHTLGAIGGIHFLRGDYRKALEFQSRALEIDERTGDEARIAITLNSLGAIQGALGERRKAIGLFEKALRIQERLGFRTAIAVTLANLGDAHRALGDPARGLEFMERSLRVAEEIGAPARVAAALDGLGRIHASVGDLSGALSFHERALRLAESSGLRDVAAGALANAGVCRWRLGDLSGALAAQEKALALEEALGNRAGVAFALGNLGAIAQSLGDSERAISLCGRAIERFEELGGLEGAARNLGNLGGLRQSLGDHRAALELHNRSLALRRALGDREGEAATLVNLGEIRRGLGELGEAETAVRDARRIAREIGDRALEASAAAAQGLARLDGGDPAAALRLSREAEELAAETGALPERLRALWLRGLAQLALGEPAEAGLAARDAVARLPLLVRRLGEEQGASARTVWEGIVSVGVRAGLDRGDPAEVAFFLESGRAGGLLELLEARPALLAAAIPPELAAGESLARAEVEAARARLAAACASGDRAEARAAREAVDAAESRFLACFARVQRSAKASAEVLCPAARPLEEIRARLSEEEALLLFGFFGNGAVAVVATRGGARVVLLGSAPQIDAAVDELDAPRLRKLVAAPLDLPSSIRRLIVSPHGSLARAPLALVFEERELVLTPSGTAHLLLLDAREARGEGVLALGDPEVDPRLPGSRAEAEAVGDRTLLGAEATPSRLVAALSERPRWRALHFACHGVADAERPLLSSLLLTGGPLRGLDLYRIAVPADLVVLSACETAKGRTYGGEGTLGLVRAFLFAGAPRVVASLWKVDDEATAALMKKFYELWKTRSAARALLESQRYVASQEKWRDPRFWAAWQLWGLP